VTWVKPVLDVSGGPGNEVIGSYVMHNVNRDGSGGAESFADVPTLLAPSKVYKHQRVPYLPGATPSVSFPRTLGAGPRLAEIPVGPFARRVVLAYTDVPALFDVDADVHVLLSDDEGLHWTPGGQVARAPQGTAQWEPALAVDPATGTLYATWRDTSSHAGGVLSRLHGGVSHDGGMTWTSQPVADGLSDGSQLNAAVGFPLRTGLVAVQGGAFALWCDNSGSQLPNPDGWARTDVYGSWFE
jgi:hypothetical protein